MTQTGGPRVNDTASAAVVEREAVRAIIVTPERELLLLRVRLRAPERSFWITPGGGMNPGESPLTWPDAAFTSASISTCSSCLASRR